MRPFLQFGPFVAIDFETSASNGACACAVGMARMENLRVAATYYSLIRPPSARVLFSHVHGLRWRDLKNERPFAQVWPEMARFMAGAQFLIAHNAGFDSRVLAACCEASGIATPQKPFLCTLRGARRALKLKSYSLDSVSAYFGIDLTHHHAASDARSCGLIHARLTELGVTAAQMLLPPPKARGRAA